MDKIQNTFNRTMDQIEKYSKVYREGGKLEQAVAQDGGDIAWFKDIRDALEDLMHALEEGAMSHGVATNESVTESKLTEGVLDADDDDGFMARSQLYFMARDAITLHGMINDTDDLEPWVQSKISQAAQSIDAVRRYTEYNAVEAEVEQPTMEPEMVAAESFSDQVKDFGMFSNGGNAQVQNAIQYILNDFDDATENATNSERDMLRMQAHEQLLKDLEELSDQGYEEAMDTDVRERAAQYLETGIIRIMDRLDDLGESKSEGSAWYVEQDAKEMAERDGHVWSRLPYGQQEDYRKKAKAKRANESVEETLEEGMEFDDNRKGELKTVAQDMFKNALSKAKKKAKK